VKLHPRLSVPGTQHTITIEEPPGDPRLGLKRVAPRVAHVLPFLDLARGQRLSSSQFASRFYSRANGGADAVCGVPAGKPPWREVLRRVRSAARSRMLRLRGHAPPRAGLLLGMRHANSTADIGHDGRHPG